VNFFKLEKLKIKAYKNARRAGSPVGTIEAMFNPTSIKQDYSIKYGKKQGINTSNRNAKYISSDPSSLSLTLIIDGTGVTKFGIELLKPSKSVAEQVNDFLEYTYHFHGAIHQPNYLTVEWGDLEFWGSSEFPCRLKSANVTYTSFNRDGTALRAEIEAELIYDEDPSKRVKKENKSSPDLTHLRVVKAGETLPMLCKEIYGSPSYYLRIAQINNLDNFRNLAPGQEIFFPPLEK
jgi:LysM repeat protein